MASYVDTTGTRIAWEQTGDGPNLLLVMGHRWSRRMWHPVIERLRQEFRVIALDNRGAGESATPSQPYTLSAMSADALAVLDAAGVRRAHVFGVSMGGAIAQDLAVSHPERVDRLVLGCTGLFTDEPTRVTSLRRLGYRIPDRLTNLAGRKLLYGQFRATPDIRRDLTVLAGERTSYQGLIGQAHAMSTNTVRPDDLRALRHTTLVLHGALDQVIPLAWGTELADLIPNSSSVVFPRAGHNFMATDSEATCDAVIDFLHKSAQTKA